jgi:hypothetical protein
MMNENTFQHSFKCFFMDFNEYQILDFEGFLKFYFCDHNVGDIALSFVCYKEDQV